MLTEQERRELKEMAASAALREDFLELERGARQAEERLSLDQRIQFLTVMSRLRPLPPAPWEPMIFTIARL